MYMLIALMYICFAFSSATEEGFRPSPHSTGNNVKPVKKDCTIQHIDTDLPLEMQEPIRLELLTNCEKYNRPKHVLSNTVRKVRKMYPSYTWLGVINAEFLIATGSFVRVNLMNNDMVMFAISRG